MTQTFHFQLHEVSAYINWLYFFHAWGFPANFGRIASLCTCVACRQEWLQTLLPSEQNKAEQAFRLFDDAQHLLRELDGCIQTHSRVRLLPAYSDGEDIVVFLDEPSNVEGNEGYSSVHDEMKGKYLKQVHIPLLRQQTPNKEGICWCLSDFISPHQPLSKVFSEEWDVDNTIGIFVSTVDHGMEQSCLSDDYQHLLHQTLADRLAEATAELVHKIVRTSVWGYSPDEHFSVSQLFSEKYQGRRPAVGYPSLPDVSLNFLLSRLLHFDDLGITLTESGAMQPHASVSGLMFAHPSAQHFSIGSVGEDQLADYARRSGRSIEQVRKYLLS